MIKHLVVELGLNLAGVQLVLDLFNRLLSVKEGVTMLEGEELKGFLDGSLDEIFQLLYA